MEVRGAQGGGGGATIKVMALNNPYSITLSLLSKVSSGIHSIEIPLLALSSVFTNVDTKKMVLLLVFTPLSLMTKGLGGGVSEEEDDNE